MKRSEMLKEIEKQIELGMTIGDKPRCIALMVLAAVEKKGMLPPERLVKEESDSMVEYGTINEWELEIITHEKKRND